MESILPLKNKLVQHSEGNEENGYPVSDYNKTKINYPKKPNEAHKNNLKEEINGNVTRQGQPKHTGGIQEIPRQ
jgi:hypothetical protein